MPTDKYIVGAEITLTEGTTRGKIKGLDYTGERPISPPPPGNLADYQKHLIATIKGEVKQFLKINATNVYVECVFDVDQNLESIVLWPDQNGDRTELWRRE